MDDLRPGTSRNVASSRQSGFTLIELITVMILIGILSVAALPRFFDNTFSERGFHDGVKATLQHARRTAVASRRYVCATVTAGTGAAAFVSVNMDTTLPETNTAVVACGTQVALVSTRRECVANQLCAPTGVTLGPAGGSVVIFDPLGRSVSAAKAVHAPAAITVTGQLPITVAAETGLVQ